MGFKTIDFELLKKATDEFAKANSYVGPKEADYDKTTPLGKILSKLEKNYMDDYGCYTEKMRDSINNIVALVGEATGTALPQFFKSNGNITKVPRFAVVVPVTANGGHNYTVGEPVMVTTAQSLGNLLRKNGSKGNNVCANTKDVRPATDEEIKSFLNADGNEIVLS